MDVVKKMIPCDCQNTSCREFKGCCFVATEIVRVTGGEDDPIHLMFVGQGAGRDEDINMNPKNTHRQPFVGKAGSYLRHMVKFIWESGTPVNVAISNSVRFHPLDGKKDRPPTDSELKACMPLLNRDIEILKPKMLIPLGLSTTRAMAPETIETPMGRIIGNYYNYNGIKLLPLYHPSYLVRNYGIFRAEEQGESHVRCMNLLKKAALEVLNG